MRKILLILVLIINFVFIFEYLINFGNFEFSSFWVTFFVLSLMLSALYLLRSREEEGYFPKLSMAVMIASSASLGAFLFQFLLGSVMGG